MYEIRLISNLRDTNEIFELCYKKNEPIFIAQNGYSDLVVMNIRTYKRQINLLNAYQNQNFVEAETQIIQDNSGSSLYRVGN
jgi:hypothetical protein